MLLLLVLSYSCFSSFTFMFLFEDAYILEPLAKRFLQNVSLLRALMYEWLKLVDIDVGS